MRTARGCQFSCAYCTYPIFAGQHECTAIDSIEREMNQLQANSVRYIIFVDDSFNIPLNRFKAICEMMIRNQYDFRWISFFRCVKVDDSLVSLMKQSGCMGVYLGIESLNKTVLTNMKKGGLDYFACIDLFNKYEILTLGSLIVGFPGETGESIKETIDLFNEHPTTFYNPQLYYHSTLAPIHKRAKEFNITGHSYAWSHSSMDWQEAAKWKSYMIRNVKNSILLPLYSSGIWALPYLIEQGISKDFFIEFSAFVAEQIKSGIDEKYKSHEQISKEFQSLRSLPN